MFWDTTVCKTSSNPFRGIVVVFSTVSYYYVDEMKASSLDNWMAYWNTPYHIYYFIYTKFWLIKCDKEVPQIYKKIELNRTKAFEIWFWTCWSFIAIFIGHDVFCISTHVKNFTEVITNSHVIIKTPYSGDVCEPLIYQW